MGERKGSAWWIRKVGWRASRKLTAELLLTDKWRAQKTGGKVDPSPHARNHCPSFSSPSLSLAAFPRIENRVSRVSYVTKRDFYSPVYYRFFNERKSFPPIFPLLPLCFPGRFPNFAPSRMKNIVWNKKNEMKHVARCTIQGETLHRSTHEEVPFEDFAQGRLPSIISSPRLYSGRLSTSRAASRFSRVSHALFVISIRQGTFQTRGWTRLTRDTCCSFLPFSLSSFLLVLFVYLQSQR